MDHYIKNNQTIKECTVITCPVEITLSIIGGKWKGVLIFHLLSGKKRFSELKRLMTNITHRMLTLQLRELEKNGIVKRTVYAEVPPRVEYELTEFGMSIEPIISSIYSWGEKYQSNMINPPIL